MYRNGNVSYGLQGKTDFRITGIGVSLLFVLWLFHGNEFVMYRIDIICNGLLGDSLALACIIYNYRRCFGGSIEMKQR